MVNKKKTISPENNKQESKVSRRGFLKKATYSAPVLMAMGQMKLYADGTSNSNVNTRSPDSTPVSDDGWTVE
jgi:hypothetical protein